ncbi:phosphate ABC transporter ATP-binding protein PstB [Secundilactobacillus paracollinoides]|uniref:Phosphate ABC transporter ATP-binding protein n=1 Tax=Secundilactobacillus paracollinoides TaxID=240427 RepID=A0A1B2IY69_9LACO|nr:phosphate ABC transporter ATP-binding protein PstB [Secundilactobacillus paracollinoides]ANZ61060.1 phosphate ABC transporter ATP-binding protein [Secundilactobacillus paracollinoides]ANZ66983.1 phosphate ABC transporter ATP-binding protein [Secundilactobacillus paracollinoides]
MTTPLLSTKNVHLSYGDHEALHGISLDYEPNTITALIGPSGCGKSTYLRCLNRMNDMIANVTITGTFNFKGQDLYAPNANLVALRTQIGMVFQQPNPFPFSVRENVAYGLRLNGRPSRTAIAEKVEWALKQAAVWDEVKDDLDKNALSFSGGQQQRICIARLLAVSPDIILLDEPTSALDPISSSEIEATLMALKKTYTIIIVTHNLQQASRISDRTAFMLNGDLVEVGETNQFFLTPEQQATSDYLTGKFG